jgi:hypothetical protein
VLIAMPASAVKVDPEQGLIDYAGSCQYDPQRWAMFAWQWGEGDLKNNDRPHDWQVEVNETIRQHLSNWETRYQPLQIAVSSGHGIGKSAEMGMLANWAMSTYHMARVMTTANTETQLRTKTSPEIGKWFRSAINAHWFDIGSASIKARDGDNSDSWRTDFTPWSEYNTEAFAGLHNKEKIILLQFDEASKIADKVWETAEGALTDENTVIIWIVFGNPTQSTGRFRECFRKHRKRWVTKKIDSRTVPGTNKEKINQWVEDHGEDSDFVKVRVRGEFPNQSARQFISQELIDGAMGRHLDKSQYEFAPVILTLDPAWDGGDELVFLKRQGLMMEVLRRLEKNDNDVEVANILASLETEHKADAVFIDFGYGTGIKSVGDTMGRNWELVHFAGKSGDPGCLNKRAEMHKLLREWLRQGGSIKANDTMVENLLSIETVPRLDDKLQLLGKKEMKAMGLPSPNDSDAAALSFARPVGKKNQFSEPVVAKDFDPYED